MPVSVVLTRFGVPCTMGRRSGCDSSTAYCRLAATGGAKLVPRSSPLSMIVESPGGMAKMYVPSLIS